MPFPDTPSVPGHRPRPVSAVEKTENASNVDFPKLIAKFFSPLKSLITNLLLYYDSSIAGEKCKPRLRTVETL